jgi:hypothetical protein
MEADDNVFGMDGRIHLDAVWCILVGIRCKPRLAINLNEFVENNLFGLSHPIFDYLPLVIWSQRPHDTAAHKRDCHILVHGRKGDRMTTVLNSSMAREHFHGRRYNRRPLLCRTVDVAIFESQIFRLEYPTVRLA